MKKPIIYLLTLAILLSICNISVAALTIPTTDLPAGYVDNSEPTASEIQTQIQNIYKKAKNSRGGSFSGYCGAYVGWQLYHMGINTSLIAPNGKDAWEQYKNISTTSGGYTVNKYSVSNSTIKQTLKDLCANGTKNVYNIMVCLQKGNTSSSATYGHVSFIHAIIDGVVYFSESGSMNLEKTYYEGDVIAKPLSYVCDYIYTYTLNGYVPQVEGIIHFTGKGNPNSVSVEWLEDSANSWLSNTDAKVALKAHISGSNQSGLTEEGIYLYDYAGNQLAFYSAPVATTLTNTTVPVYYTISQRLRYTLSPGTQYKYKIYIEINNKKHESPIYSFTTTGTHSHKSGTDWLFDNTYHWHECSTCGGETNKAFHNDEYDVCTVCGKIASTNTSGYYTYGVDDGEVYILDVDDSISGKVTVPSTLGGFPVTMISEEAFIDCAELTSVIIPNGVTDIGNAAFQSCTNLKSITIPDSVTYIGWFAFRDCTSLENVMLGNGITSLDYCTFEGCTSLENITIPDRVTFIGDFVFNGCENLVSVDMPDNIEVIGNEAFEFCTNLTSITIPVGVTYIGNWAFLGCDSLESVYFENTKGWSIETYGNGDIVEIFPTDLANPQTAAEYLIDTYFNDTWICTTVDCNHQNLTDWITDMKFHWRQCETCGESVDIELHNTVNGICSVCGETTGATAVMSSATATFGDTVVLTVELMNALLTDALSFELILPEGISLIESENTCWEIESLIDGINVSTLQGVWVNDEEINPNGIVLSLEFKIEEKAFLGANEILFEFYSDDTAFGKTEDAVSEVAGVIYVHDYVSGDIDGKEGVDAKDAIYLLYNVFFGDGQYPVDQPCDFNGDDTVDASDAIYLLYHVFFGDKTYPLN